MLSPRPFNWKSSFVLVQVMLQTLCDRVHVQYFQLVSVAVTTVLHNYATGSYEVCIYRNGTLNNGLVAFNFHTSGFWLTTQEYSAFTTNH